MAALRYLQDNAARLLIDPRRIVIAGDSAGAHIAAQLGALVTTPGYADTMGVTPTIAPEQLRGLVLACGPYDMSLAEQTSDRAGRRFIKAVLWAYAGRRNFLDDPAFATWSVTDNLTGDFPPSLITVGNADPLKAHSEHLASRLGQQEVRVETVLWPDGHRPSLGHEYQFDLDTAEGRQFLERMLTFLQQRL